MPRRKQDAAKKSTVRFYNQFGWPIKEQEKSEAKQISNEEPKTVSEDPLVAFKERVAKKGKKEEDKKAQSKTSNKNPKKRTTPKKSPKPEKKAKTTTKAEKKPPKKNSKQNTRKYRIKHKNYTRNQTQIKLYDNTIHVHENNKTWRKSGTIQTNHVKQSDISDKLYLEYVRIYHNQRQKQLWRHTTHENYTRTL